MTTTSFQPGQNRNSATQKTRSSGVSLGFDRFWIRCELLAQGQLDNRLLPAASEEDQNAAKQ